MRYDGSRHPQRFAGRWPHATMTAAQQVLNLPDSRESALIVGPPVKAAINMRS